MENFSEKKKKNPKGLFKYSVNYVIIKWVKDH